MNLHMHVVSSSYDGDWLLVIMAVDYKHKVR